MKQPTNSVLIIAGDYAILEELEKYVKQSGMSCLSMQPGSDALRELFEKADAGVVILEQPFAMSEDGEELIKHLQEKQRIPVLIAMTEGEDLPRGWKQRNRPYGCFTIGDEPNRVKSLLRGSRRNFLSRAGVILKQDFLDMILHSASEGFYLVDSDLRYIEVNDAYCDMLGYTADELLSMTVDEIEYDDPREEVENQKQRADREGRIILRKRHRHREGYPVDVELRATQLQTDAGVLYCLFCRNLTEELRIEKRMRLQATALAAAANAVVITDPNGRIQWVNRAFSNITGYTEEEALGASTSELLKSGEHDKAFYNRMWGEISNGEVWNGEIRNRRKDGSLYTEEMTITPVFDHTGTLSQYIAIKQDITESKKLEQMLQRAQRLESIGALASGVAHDLNNALSPIVMSSDILKANLKSPEDQEVVEIIKKSALRGSDVLKQLLSFARGSDEPFSTLNVKPLLDGACKIMQKTFPKNITFDLQFQHKLPGVYGDATQLHQVFSNLLINARDAMPDGGTLTVSTDVVNLDDKSLFLNTHEHTGEFVRIRVEDTGIGMPDDVRERIFDPFFTTKEVGKGTGLGLSTSIRILNAHEGFLDVHTEEGSGSVFDVYLPVRSDSPTRGQPSNEKTPPSGKGERVLVVDDEHIMRHALKGILSPLSYQVTLAENGQKALERILETSEPFDLIILDLMMPVMDGNTFIQKACADSDTLPPILIISGMAEKKMVPDELPQLTSLFLPKPFTTLQLASGIRQLLD